ASISNAEKRAIIYEKMARDLDEHGAAFLKHGETSQSLSLSDLFAIKDGSITPILKAAIPPVRANVLYLRPEYSVHISEAVRSVFLPYFDKSKISSYLTTLENSTLYHFSMFHASHHIAPVLATEYEIKAEANAVKAVAEGLCPLKIVLDRVVLTSTGVLLGCWQVTSGTDPVTIRAKLRSALPRAPGKQLYDAAILHTSFARLLGRPNTSPEEADETRFFHDLVTRLNNKLNGFQLPMQKPQGVGLDENSSVDIVENYILCPYLLWFPFCANFKAMVSELWYVEEFDVLALALDGKMKVRKFQLGCSQT
ncbi:hypothetical protein C3L33_14278, partial [Rhododendron williamsianum]